MVQARRQTGFRSATKAQIFEHHPAGDLLHAAKINVRALLRRDEQRVFDSSFSAYFVTVTTCKFGPP